jgi:hypothetical protein
MYEFLKNDCKGRNFQCNNQIKNDKNARTGCIIIPFLHFYTEKRVGA